MSFVGCVGTLMAESGLYEIMESTFGGVLKMLNGKKFTQNIHALRLVVEELLRPLFNTEDLTIVIMTWKEFSNMRHMRAEQPGAKPGFSEWGVTGKAAPSQARRTMDEARRAKSGLGFWGRAPPARGSGPGGAL